MFGFAGKASAGQTSSSARRAYETMVGGKFKFKDLVLAPRYKLVPLPSVHSALTLLI